MLATHSRCWKSILDVGNQCTTSESNAGYRKPDPDVMNWIQTSINTVEINVVENCCMRYYSSAAFPTLKTVWVKTLSTISMVLAVGESDLYLDSDFAFLKRLEKTEHSLRCALLRKN
jgi:hypothetical protein